MVGIKIKRRDYVDQYKRNFASLRARIVKQPYQVLQQLYEWQKTLSVKQVRSKKASDQLSSVT